MPAGSKRSILDLFSMNTLPFAQAPDRPALIVPVMGRSLDDLEQKALAVAGDGSADLIEWRVDALEIDVERLSEDELSQTLREALKRCKKAELPVLATFRSPFEGGLAPGDAEQTQPDRLLTALIAAGPDAIDIEHSQPRADALITHAREAGVSVVLSSHNWLTTPHTAEIVDRFTAMAESGADVAKIAVTPQRIDDTVEMLTALRMASASLTVPLIGISMGPLGAIVRTYGHEFGSAATFVTVGEGSAPGQISARALREYLRL